MFPFLGGAHLCMATPDFQIQLPFFFPKDFIIGCLL
jgi:hypothetical protein